MRTFDALWIAYQAETNPTWAYDYKAVIDGQTYAAAEMWTFGKTGGLIADDFGIGNCQIQQLMVSVTAKAGVSVGKNAKAEVYVRIIGDSGTTLWHSLGVFFIDGRKKLNGGKLQFDCLDRMAYADVPFITDGELLGDYPIPMDTAAARICTKIGTTLDARTTISHTLTIPYPNDMTMRQVLAQIASAHGGNFCITEDDKLRLVVPGYGGTALAAITGSNAQKTFAGNTPTTFDSVAMVYAEDGSYYESGATKLHTVDVTNTWATQAICDAVAAIIAGYAYTPYNATGADLDPAIELGDHITIDGVPCNVWKWTWTNRLYCDIEVPSSTDSSGSEFGYTGTITSALGKKVSLGASYFGTSISKAEGLKIAKGDGSSKLVFNSDTLSWQVTQGGNMVDRLYFDAVKGDLQYNGKFGVDAIEAMKANIDVVISNTIITQNLYAQKGIIAELTVDQLDTSDKVANYLNQNTGPVKFIRIYDDTIEFIESTVSSGGAQQITDRKGTPVYWMDKDGQPDYSGITNDVTPWPVLTYIYTDVVRLTIDANGEASVDISSINVADASINIAFTDGQITNYAVTRDDQGRVTTFDGISISYSGSGGGTTTPPTLINASVTGATISLYFDLAMESPAGKQTEFSAKINGTPVAVSAAALNANTTEIDLTLATSTAVGQTILVSFTKGTVKSASGVNLESFTDQSVTNNNQQAPPQDTHQVWSSFPSSPFTTEGYPYQAVVHLNDDHYDYLVGSKYKLYDDYTDIYITNLRRELLVYIYAEGEWNIYNSLAERQKFTTIYEANNDVYTDANLNVVRFAKTTG